MYCAKTDTLALSKMSELVEELGQIEYTFSDKTDALTRNEMAFRCRSIAGAADADLMAENKRIEMMKRIRMNGSRLRSLGEAWERVEESVFESCEFIR